MALGHDFHVKKKVQTFSLYCFLTSNFKEKLTANSLLAAFYVNNELYDNYIGELLQEIDDTIHALPNMKGAETWISPFRNMKELLNCFGRIIAFLKETWWKLYHNFMLKHLTRRNFWFGKINIEKGTVLRIKVTLLPCYN